MGLLATAATVPGLRSPAEANLTNFSMQPDAMAHEQHRLLWCILTKACENCKESRKKAMQHGFLKILLLYVNLDASDNKVCAQALSSTEQLTKGLRGSETILDAIRKSHLPMSSAAS
jgi:hypothetical protein